MTMVKVVIPIGWSIFYHYISGYVGPRLPAASFGAFIRKRKLPGVVISKSVLVPPIVISAYECCGISNIVRGADCRYYWLHRLIHGGRCFVDKIVLVSPRGKCSTCFIILVVAVMVNPIYLSTQNLHV